MNKPLVLIVEDDAFSRLALTNALLYKDIKVIAAVDNAFDALAAQEKWNPNVALCDLDLGVGPTGIDIAIALRKINPQIGIIFLTSFRDPRLASPEIQPLPAGAILLNKNELRSMSTVIMQIVAALENPTKIRREEWSKTGNFQSLSDNQIEILIAVANGVTTADIAQQKAVSEQAIEKTINRICKKLGIETNSDRNTRVQLVRAYFYGAGKEI
jgi:two-component system, NarL family, nitrate/nitrite response regulator NarL